MPFVNKRRNCMRFKTYVLKFIFTQPVFYLLLLMFACSFTALAQVSVAPLPASDTVRVIQIIQGKSLREKTIDSVTTLKTIAGNVILREGRTLFYCDSATINSNSNVMEAFGNVHINQNDSIDTYSQYLRYVGANRIAYLKKDVKLTDKKGTLYTQELEYDLKSSIGTYKTGGRVVNATSVLTSMEGTYYADTKDVYFKKNVHLVDPKYDIVSDSLLYNTQSQLVTFITATKIKSKNGGDIYTTTGTYDLKDGKAFFGNRTVIKDSTRTYVANESAYDEKSGIAQLEGNAVIKDSVNGYTILGNQIFLDKNTNAFLATKKPLLIFKGDGNDSTFIAADTLFSGVEKRDMNGNKIIETDTLKKITVISFADSTANALQKKDSLKNKAFLNIDWLKPVPPLKKEDSLFTYVIEKNNQLKTNEVINDSSKEAALTKKADAAIAKIRDKEPLAHKLPAENTLSKQAATGKPVDSLFSSLAQKDSLHTNTVKKTDSLKKSTLTRSTKDTSIRYFEAFHNVRIFNDSVQAVCDSLFYSSEDSVFRMYQRPLLFNNKSQVSGDTIYLYTENKKAKRMYVFENGILINKHNDQMYNQMGGRTINGYFNDGAIDYVRIKGSPAESVFYPQDNDSAFIGMNRSKGDVIDVYFVDKKVNKVKFINDVDGTLYPIRQRPEDQKYLKNFKWWESRRPKSKFELFE
jgi:lipopolysaccharide export system protein LptA